MPNDPKLPATRGDLEALRTELSSRMDQMQDHLIEAMRDMQTEVLRAFHNWVSRSNNRKQFS
jgi:hypothetical protein